MKVLYVDSNKSSKSSSIKSVMEDNHITLKLTDSMLEALNLLGVEDFDFVFIESNRTESNFLTRFMEHYKIPFAIYTTFTTNTKNPGYVWHNPVHEIPHRINSMICKNQ